MKKNIIIILNVIVCISLFSSDTKDLKNLNMSRKKFIQKLSIDGVIKSDLYNIDAIQKYEDRELRYSKEEQLGRISIF